MRINLFLRAGLAAAAWAAATPAPAQGGGAAALKYIDGIEALDAGRYPAAVSAFTEALDGDADNGAYLRARGVACTLAEDFPAALADLQRAMRLQPQDRETKLWLAVAHRMSGDFEKGALNFTHGGGITADYANLVYNDMAGDYAMARYRGSYFDRELEQNVKATEPVRKLFPAAARAYAARHKAAGAAAGDALMARMQASMARGDWAAASQDLAALRRNAPDDPALRGYGAQCLLGLGNGLKAREEFTRVLGDRPRWAEGYLGRAQAAVLIGDARRAHADLATAAELGANAAAQTRIKELLAQGPAGSPALAAHRAANAKRARYDEAYQDRIFLLDDAARREPKNADRPEMLARFLFNHMNVPLLWASPRSSEQVRPQSSVEKQRELERALQATDAALKIDAGHANAMATAGWIHYRIGRVGDAGRMADEGLRAEGQNLRLLRLKAQLLLDTAGALAAQASALRTGRTETHRERRSDGEYEVTTRHPPSAADLARAAQLEAQAASLERQARDLAQRASEVEERILPGLVNDADKALASGDARKARKALTRLHQLNADASEFPSRMAEVCRIEKDARGQRLFAALATPPRETTVADELKAAWDQITRTSWGAASATLDRAATIDPVDARVPAYRSVILAARGDAASAAQQREAAFALEEARAQLMGASLWKTDRPLPSLADAGLTVALRLQQGNEFLASRQFDKAHETFVGTLALEQRTTRDDLVLPVPSAMLPAPSGDATKIPDAPSLASLLAWSRLGTARALLGLGRTDDADREFKATRSYLANWPATAPGRETLNVADAWARLGLAQSAAAAKRLDEAFRLLNSGEGWPWGLPQDLEQQKRALSQQVVAARQKAAEDELHAQMNLSPQQMRIRRAEGDLAEFEKQRESTAAELARPGLSAREQEVLRASLAELDRMIALYKQQRDKLQQAPEEETQAPQRPPRRSRVYQSP